MLLGLSNIIRTPDSVLPFETSLDLSDLQFGGSYPVTEPVVAEAVEAPAEVVEEATEA